MTIIHAHRVGTMPRPSTRPISELTDLLGPAREHAACKGKAPGWDRDVGDDTPWGRVKRYTTAARICAGCPERDSCEPGHDDDGIYAGRLYIKGNPVEPLTCTWTGCRQLFITTDPSFEYCSPRCHREARLAAERDRRRAGAVA